MMRIKGPIVIGRLIAALLASLLPSSGLAFASSIDAPTSFGVEGLAPVLVAQAEGAQLYECKADASGALTWAFREPIATLISEGKTIGRHYAGPSWELNDGGEVQAKLLASAPGTTASDVPLLKLSVVEHRGGGLLKDVTIVLRLNTIGGVLKGPCSAMGELRAEPYSADYLFLR